MKTEQELIDGMVELAKAFQEKGMTFIVTANFGSSAGIHIVDCGDTLILQGLIANALGSVHHRIANTKEKTE